MKTNKVRLLLLLALIFPIYVFSVPQFFIKGNIQNGVSTEPLVLLKYNFQKTDFVQIQELSADQSGDFQYASDFEQPSLFKLQVGNRAVIFPIESDSKVNITITKDGIEILGNENIRYVEDFKVLIKSANQRYFGDLMKPSTKQESSPDVMKKTMLMYKNERLPKFYAELENAIDKMGTSVAAIYCLNYLDVNKSFTFIERKVKQLQRMNLRGGSLKKWITVIENARKVQVGEKALWAENITDLNGNDVKLQAPNTEYVLIDFWASWCKPCMIEIPIYQKIYSRFKDCGFEIIGVNHDFKIKQCQNATEKFQIRWPVVFDQGKKLGELYLVSQLPQNILLDKNGIIVAKNLSVWEVEELLNKRLGL